MLKTVHSVQAPAFPATWTALNITSSFSLATLPSPAPPCFNLDHLVPDLGEVAAGLHQLVHLLADQASGGVLPAVGLLLGRLPATSQAATDQDDCQKDDKKEEEQSDKEEKGNKASGVSKSSSSLLQS